MLSRPSHTSGIPHMLQDLWRPGYCNTTEYSDPECGEVGAHKGSWIVPVPSEEAAQLGCIRRCVACDACHYISLSLTDRDCSWFDSCKPTELQRSAEGWKDTGHRTLRVRTRHGLAPHIPELMQNLSTVRRTVPWRSLPASKREVGSAGYCGFTMTST